MGVKPVFVTEDGKIFDSKAQAEDHERRPKIFEVMKSFIQDENVINFLIECKESIVDAFDAGTVRRVKAGEAKQLAAALEELKLVTGHPKLAFLVDNADAVKLSFRWPAVKRMTDEEKKAEAKLALMALENCGESLADWIIAKKETILEAYNAGKEKRMPSPLAQQKLSAFLEERRAEKLAKQRIQLADEAAAAGVELDAYIQAYNFSANKLLKSQREATWASLLDIAKAPVPEGKTLVQLFEELKAGL